MNRTTAEAADAERKSLLRKGTAARGEIAVKIVTHLSGEGFAVETTVNGDRRYPTEPPMSLTEAQTFALQQLDNPRPAEQTEQPEEPTESKPSTMQAEPGALIFGYTWKDIQRAQAGGALVRPITAVR